LVTHDPLDEAGNELSASSFGPLLPPDDRIWRHPSELSVDSSASATLTHAWGTAAFSAVGGALAVGALWFAVGNDGGRLVTERVSLTPVQSIAPQVVDTSDWGRVVTATARDGTVSVRSSSTNAALAGGFAYRDDGYLLTSARAVNGTTSLIVVDSEGVTQDARLVGTDSLTDVSVLHVEDATGVVVVATGDPLEAGDVLAIVDPAGDAVASTVTDTTANVSTTDGDLVLGLVQLDAELGTIPAGGPVVDDTGAVVGMTTSTDPTAAAAMLPIDVARQVAGELIDQGEVSHAWLGVTARDVAADELGPGRPPGAMVTSLTSTGPAALSGASPGDVIVAVGSTPVDSVAAMVSALRHHQPGDTIDIVVDRGSVPVSLTVVLGALDGASG
jgi:putative serine protease PepD